MDLSTTVRAGAVIGGVGAALGVGVVLARRSAEPETARSPGPGVDHRPTRARRAHDLAVAWWPQAMAVVPYGATRALAFQSVVGNLGAVDARVSGATIAYSLHALDRDGVAGPALARGSAALDRLETTRFPPPFGADAGRPATDFGRELRHVERLSPDTTGIIGAGHPTQRLPLGDARDGLYVLRQRIERPPGAGDDDPANDVRDTTFELRRGSILQLASAYAGTPGPARSGAATP